MNAMNDKSKITETRLIARRRLLAGFGAIIALPFLPRVPGVVQRGVLIQTSPVAGFQYHEGVRVWNGLRPGDPLHLVREPDNKYDQRAVRVDWRGGRKLGYVPRYENTAVSQMLDRGETLTGRVARLRSDPNPWKRVEFEIWLS